MIAVMGERDYSVETRRASLIGSPCIIAVGERDRIGESTPFYSIGEITPFNRIGESTPFDRIGDSTPLDRVGERDRIRESTPFD